MHVDGVAHGLSGISGRYDSAGSFASRDAAAPDAAGAARPPPAAHDSFMRITSPHAESDAVISCRPGPRRPVVDLAAKVEFYCHRHILSRRCAVFADAAEFESLSFAVESRRTRIELNADEDIVFEVLRFVYCGAIYFPLGFRARFAQFLTAVDFLGIEEMAERNGLEHLPAPGFSVFDEPGVEQWLQDLPTEDVLSFLREGGILGSNSARGTDAVGFNLRRRFLTRLVTLRPQDLTVDVLGEHLYRRLVYAGSTMTPCGTLGRNRLHLPGTVIYAELGGGGMVRCANLGGLEPVSAAARLDVRPGRLWHANKLLDAKATRASLLGDDGPPPWEVVTFLEGIEGWRAFDSTLRRAETRTLAERDAFHHSMRWLASKAQSVGQNLAEQRTHLEVFYRDPHELKTDLILCQDSDLDANEQAHMVVLAVRPGGPAGRAGLSTGWVLSDQPPELSVGAPPPGHAAPFTAASWSPLQNLFSELRAPAHVSFVATFDARPFGFSWTQEGDFIVIREVRQNGRAMQQGVYRGMVLRSFTPDGEARITGVSQLMEALRGEQAKVTMVFGWRQGRKCVTTSTLAGLTFEQAEIGALAEGDAVQPAGRGVIVSHVPVGHPATRDGIGPGWQLLNSTDGLAWEVSPYVSIDQLPAKLRSPSLTLQFTAPHPLGKLLPLDEPHGQVVPPDTWESIARGAVLNAVPWVSLQRSDLGPLWRFSAVVPPLPVDTEKEDATGFSEDDPMMDDFAIDAEAMSPSSTIGNPGTRPESCREPSPDDTVVDVVILGRMPPTSRVAQWRIGSAGPTSGLLWELRQALEVAMRDAPNPAQYPNLVAAALWRSHPGRPSLPGSAQSSTSPGFAEPLPTAAAARASSSSNAGPSSGPAAEEVAAPRMQPPWRRSVPPARLWSVDAASSDGGGAPSGRSSSSESSPAAARGAEDTSHAVASTSSVAAGATEGAAATAAAAALMAPPVPPGTATDGPGSSTAPEGASNAAMAGPAAGGLASGGTAGEETTHPHGHSGCVGGVVLGESVAQILFRWTLHVQRERAGDLC